MSVQFMTSIADAREISFRNAMPEKKPDSALLGVRRLEDHPCGLAIEVTWH